MRSFVLVLVLVFSLACLVAPSVFADRKEPPTAKEIADAATRVRFDTANSAAAKEGVKRVRVTPALPPDKIGLEELAAGKIIAQIETAEVKPFPEGIYPIFLAKVGNEWRAYAERGGKIVAVSRSVKVEMVGDDKTMKPQIEFNLKITIQFKRVRITIEW